LRLAGSPSAGGRAWRRPLGPPGRPGQYRCSIVRKRS